MSVRSFVAALVGILWIVLAHAARPEPQRRPPGPRVHTGDPTHGWQFCRLVYDRVRTEADGNGWTTDYPQADRNLMIRVSEMTTTPVAFEPPTAGRLMPDHRIVAANDPALFMCPFLMATDVGTLQFRGDEIATLRAWFAKGGFLWVDDFWGDAALTYWLAELSLVLGEVTLRVLDGSRYPFALDLPQVSHISFWKGRGGETSERGAESAEVHVLGVEDDHGRLIVLMTHNTDISDTWERERDPEFFDEFAPVGYRVGVGVVLHAMSH